jgi:hypothetical protein
LTARSMIEMAEACLATAGTDIEVDLTDLRHLSYAGYSALMVVRATLEELGGSLTLSNAVGAPARFLQLVSDCDPHRLADR